MIYQSHPRVILACSPHLSSGSLALLLVLLAFWVVTLILLIVNVFLILSLKSTGPFRRTHLIILVGAQVLTAEMFAGAFNRAFWTATTPAIGIPLLVMWQFVYLIRLRQKSKPPKPKYHEDSYCGPRCVACRVAIRLDTALCPVCGWTQPGHSGAS